MKCQYTLGKSESGPVPGNFHLTICNSCLRGSTGNKRSGQLISWALGAILGCTGFLSLSRIQDLNTGTFSAYELCECSPCFFVLFFCMSFPTPWVETNALSRDEKKKEDVIPVSAGAAASYKHSKHIHSV